MGIQGLLLEYGFGVGKSALHTNGSSKEQICVVVLVEQISLNPLLELMEFKLMSMPQCCLFCEMGSGRRMWSQRIFLYNCTQQGHLPTIYFALTVLNFHISIGLFLAISSCGGE